MASDNEDEEDVDSIGDGSVEEQDGIPAVDDGMDFVPAADSVVPDPSVDSSLSRDHQVMEGQVSDEMEEIKYGSILFLKIVEQQQQIRNYLLLLREWTTLSVAIMVEVTFLRQDLNEEKLAKAGFKFIAT